jgi:hypothetical protein
LQKSPQNGEARKYQQEAYADRALALSQLGRTAEALADWDRGIDVANVSARERLRASRALALARSGDHKRARAEADELAKDKSLSGAVLYDLARIASLASAAVGKDAKLPPADQSKLAEQHVVRAVQLLRRAKDAGHFQDAAEIATLKKDTDLDPLRSRADFKKLLAELEAPVNTPKK